MTATITPLTETEVSFLRKLSSGVWFLKGPTPRPAIQSLITRGYCRASKERLGPLGIYTGRTVMELTEAGRLVLEGYHHS